MKIAILCLLAASFGAGAARADTSSAAVGKTTLSENDGAAIYQHVCQGCHMADAKGATGAGTIPALAGNPKLGNTGYPATIVLNGYGGMPRVGAILDDAQVAAVVDFVTTHFGNHATDHLTAAQVHAMRPANSSNTASE